jgi:hypothetical protein
MTSLKYPKKLKQNFSLNNIQLIKIIILGRSANFFVYVV